jgi:phosphoglycerate dehydrogenase-like enzyme
MKKSPGNKELRVGSRFRLSALGVERCRKFKDRTGVIVGFGQSGSSVRAVFEGRRRPVTLHESYVERDSEHSQCSGEIQHRPAVK